MWHLQWKWKWLRLSFSLECDKYQFRPNHSFISFPVNITNTHTLPPLILTIELLLSIDDALSTVRGCQFVVSAERLRKQCRPRLHRPMHTHTHATHQSDNWQWQKFMSCFCLDKDDGKSPSHSGHRQHMLSPQSTNWMRTSSFFSVHISKPFNSLEADTK